MASWLPPVPDGHTRFWHGGVKYKGGSRWLTQDRNYAEGYAAKNNSDLHYVDVPNGSPHLKKAFDDSGTSAKAPFVNFDAPEDIAKQLRLVHNQKANFTPNRNADGTPVESDSSQGAIVSGAAAGFAPESAMPSSREFAQNLLAPPEQQEGESASQPRKMNALDMLQMGLDAVGVADPTPIADGANAVLSVARAAFDPAHAGEHLKNAGISAISMVPYFGDIAKLFKYGGKAAKATGAAADAGHAANAAGHAAGGAGGNGGRGRGGMASTILGMFGGGGSMGGGSGGSVGSSPGSDDGSNTPNPINPALGALDGIADSIMAFGQKIVPAGVALYVANAGLKAFIGWLQDVDKQAKETLENNRSLAEFNGSMAATYLRLDNDRLLREIDKADAMAGPTWLLSRTQTGYEQSQHNLLMPFQELRAYFSAAQPAVADMALNAVAVATGLREVSILLKALLRIKDNDDAAKNATQYAAREELRLAQKDKLR